ncbi:unnamed protein product [Brassica rapa subsp. trilocularis]
MVSLQAMHILTTMTSKKSNSVKYQLLPWRIWTRILPIRIRTPGAIGSLETSADNVTLSSSTIQSSKELQRDRTMTSSRPKPIVTSPTFSFAFTSHNVFFLYFGLLQTGCSEVPDDYIRPDLNRFPLLTDFLESNLRSPEEK